MKAVVFIDVQNDFVTGSLGSEWAQKTVPNIIKYAKECRSKGYALYATCDTHYVGDQNAREYSDTLEGKRLPIPHCVEGTEGHQIVDGLVKDENRDVIIRQGNIFDKSTFGSFLLMHEMSHDFTESIGMVGEPLDEIQICGFCTSICVISNALILRAQFPNTPITILSDLCADISEESHTAALTVAQNCMIDVHEAF